MTLNDKKVKELFPILSGNIVYLDSAATAQKPKCVLDAITDFYLHKNANPMRGLYDLSITSTDDYELSRKACARFIGAADACEIIFTRNATESLNLAADCIGATLTPDDEILVATSEHHSNFLPWKKACERSGASIRFLDCMPDGIMTPEMLKAALTPKTKLFSVAQISNVFGRINPVEEYAKICHENGTLICIDASQSVPHIAVDVRKIDADFLAFSGHKLYGPMGIGMLYGKKKLLKKLPPFLRGGEMIDYVSKERIIFADLPHKYEAGTVSAADAAGLRAAIEFVEGIGFDEIEKRELHLTELAMEGMKKIPHVRLLGGYTPGEHNGILTFTIDDVHPHDIAAMFAAENVCIRAGHHCAQPLHLLLGIPSTVRASIAFYNTDEDIEKFLSVLATIRSQMGYE